MTYIYGASEQTAENYYLDSLPLDLKKNIASIIFKLFYMFLQELFNGSKFFKEPLSEIMFYCNQSFLKNNKIIIWTSDKSSITLEYYSLINYRLDRIIQGERNTILYNKLSNNFDKLKTLRSAPANITQSLDALYVRLILNKLAYPIITIHDSFGIDILNIDILIEIANHSIKEIHFDFKPELTKNYKNYYSSHILI